MWDLDTWFHGMHGSMQQLRIASGQRELARRNHWNRCETSGIAAGETLKEGQLEGG